MSITPLQLAHPIRNRLNLAQFGAWSLGGALTLDLNSASLKADQQEERDSIIPKAPKVTKMSYCADSSSCKPKKRDLKRF